MRKFNLFQFQHKEFSILLIGAALLVILFLALLQWKRKVKKRIGEEKLVGQLINNYSPRLFYFKFVLVLLAFVLCVIAIMNPRKPGSSITNRKGIDIAIALDVSKSMLAADLAPNRLERAKQFIGKLMNSMPGDRIALILFAGKAYLQMPLTLDHNAANLFVSSASPEAVPQQGTVISEAIEKSAFALAGSETKFKSIVLITDGEDHDDDAISTAKELASKGVMINSIGIGSIEGTTITDPDTGDVKRDETGNPVISKLNEEILKEIAASTNGVYTKLESSDAAVAVLKEQFSKIDRKAFADFSQVNFKTFYLWPAAIAFLFLLIEVLVPETRKKKFGSSPKTLTSF